MSLLGQDWRLVPFALAAWAGAWAGTAGLRLEPSGWLGLAGSLLFGALLLWRRRAAWAALLLVVLLASGAVAALREVRLHTSLPAFWAGERAVGTARVTLLAEPRRMASGLGAELTVTPARLLRLEVGGRAVETRQRVVLLGSGEPAAVLARRPVGAVVEVRGRLAPPEPDAPEALALRVQEAGPVLSPPGPVDSLANAMRAGLVAAASHSPPEQAALVPSLVVGDTSAIPDGLAASFRATSLSHLLAVSGANLTLLLVVLLWAARSAGVRGWWVRGVAVAGVGLFVVLCRGEPSVLRAAAMGLVGLSALGLGAGRRSLRNLALATWCLLVVDPWLSRSWGFALSVTASAGLVLFAAGWATRLRTWLPAMLAEAVALPLAAQLATQPLVVAMSGRVSLVGVFANVAAAPFVGPATVLGLVSASLWWFPAAAVVPAWLAGWCVQPILWIAHGGAGLPGASMPWPADAPGVLLISLACIGVALAAGRWLSRAVVVVGVAAVLALVVVQRPQHPAWPGGWSVAFCDVGQGDAAVLRAAEGVGVLVDAGPDPAPTLDCLAGLGIRRIPLLVLTHFHADHVGGAEAVLRRYRPGLVLVGPLASPAAASARLTRVAADVGSRVVVAARGQVLRVGDLTWRTIEAWDPGAPGAGAGEGSSLENDSSVVGMAEVGGLRVLLTGDIEPTAQRRVLQHTTDAELRADVLKLPHHGSGRQEPEFLAATGAAVAVVSAGTGNDYGHPAVGTLRVVGRLGMEVARTDEQGSIVFARDGAVIRGRTAGAGR